MIVLCILCIILAVGGLGFGIARSITCAKEDKYTVEENKKLDELNQSLQQTRKNLQDENDLLLNSNKKIREEFDKSYEKLKNLTDTLDELTHQKQKNETDIILQEQYKKNLEAQTLTITRSIEDLTSGQKEAMSAALESYFDVLEMQYQQKEKEINEDLASLDNLYAQRHSSFLQTLASYDEEIERKRDELERSLESIRTELDKIKSTRAAAIEAQLREQEIKEKATFYTLGLNDADKRDVAYLQSIEFNLREARPLRMLIWTSFYRDKLNDLAARTGAVGACGIYKLTHVDSGISYIGQAKDIKGRWADHVKCSLGIDTPVTSHLYAFTREKGIDNFTFEVLEKCSAADLNEKEKFYIDLYQTYDYGLNNNRGIGK